MTGETTKVVAAPADLLAVPCPPAGWLGAQLRRLQRLLELQQAHSKSLNPGGRRLLNHAIFVTYIDCVDSGGADMAREVLRGARVHERPSTPTAPQNA